MCEDEIFFFPVSFTFGIQLCRLAQLHHSRDAQVKILATSVEMHFFTDNAVWLIHACMHAQSHMWASLFRLRIFNWKSPPVWFTVIVSRLQQVDQDMSATYSSISGCLKFVNAISKRLKWENLMTIWFNWMLTFWIQLTMIQSSLVNSFIHLSIWTFTKRYYWNFKSQVS